MITANSINAAIVHLGTATDLDLAYYYVQTSCAYNPTVVKSVI